jgi:hypothetical protein
LLNRAATYRDPERHYTSALAVAADQVDRRGFVLVLELLDDVTGEIEHILGALTSWMLSKYSAGSRTS